MGFFVSFDSGELVDGMRGEQIYLLGIFSCTRWLGDGGKTSLLLLLCLGTVLVKELE